MEVRNFGRMAGAWPACALGRSDVRYSVWRRPQKFAYNLKGIYIRLALIMHLDIYPSIIAVLANLYDLLKMIENN